MSLITLWKVESQYFHTQEEAVQHVKERWDKEFDGVPFVKTKVIWDVEELCDLLNKAKQGGQ